MGLDADSFTALCNEVFQALRQFRGAWQSQGLLRAELVGAAVVRRPGSLWSSLRRRVGRALRQREKTLHLNLSSYSLVGMGDNIGFFSKFENHREKAVVLIFGVSRVLAKFWTV